jgi:hypothetical protein
MNPLHRFYFWKHERRLKKLNKGYDYQPATPELTAIRFKLLFNLHGIEVAEIPEVKGFESITLHDLNSNDRLLQKLTPEFLIKTANTFGIRIEWPRSGEPNLYEHLHWYKEGLPNFFDDLKDMNFEETYDPFCVVTTQNKFDNTSNEYQPFILMLKKKIDEVGDKDVYKYYLESVWDWHHPPCRLQAKGLATKYYQLTRRMVTIYTTSKDNFHRISEGFIPPEDGLRRLHDISLEEYGVIKLPHMEPYENFEHDAVLEEMKQYGIDSINFSYIDNESRDKSEAEYSESKSKPGRKQSKVKLEIKIRFIQTYQDTINKKEISCAKAAREYFSNLAEKERVILFRSTAEYEPLTYEEAEKRAERTLTEYYAQQKNNKL